MTTVSTINQIGTDPRTHDFWLDMLDHAAANLRHARASVLRSYDSAARDIANGGQMLDPADDPIDELACDLDEALEAVEYAHRRARVVRKQLADLAAIHASESFPLTLGGAA